MMDRVYEGGKQHVSDAIKINAQRDKIYAAVTEGKSRSLTRLLIVIERLCLLPMALFDWWGKKYNRQNIHIIEADFVSMAHISEPSAPLRFNGQASETHRRLLLDQIRQYRKKARHSTVRGDFVETSKSTFEMLQDVHHLETECQSLFSMTRHILESIGIAAIHAVTYSEQSREKTKALSKCFLMFQLAGVITAVRIDKKAQACHALGAGIIENDVPHIPFEEAWHTLNKSDLI
jgi:hypothetical protein